MATYKERQRLSFRYEGKKYDVYGYSDRELERKKTEKIEAIKRNEIIVESSMTVRAWSEQFIKAYKQNCMKDYVLDNYKYQLKHYILEEIGDVKLKNLKPLMCQNVLNSLEGKSTSLIHKVRIQMNEMLEKAVENDLISKNPAKNITEPKGTKNTRRALTAREEAAFLAAAKKHNHGLLFMFMWGCGCRPSEAENICGRDIQTIDGRLYLHIRGTKTKAADRYVPIPDEVAEMLPERLEPFLPICRTSEGNKINARRQRGSWQHMEYLMNIELGCKTYRNKLVPPYPLADDLCSYCLRHTYCTNLQRRGVDIRTAQKLMGHSDIRMTANIYSHTNIEDIGANYDAIIGKTAINEEDKNSAKTAQNSAEKWQKAVMVS